MSNPQSTLNQQLTKPTIHRCRFPAPNRVWQQADNGLWFSRAWLPGEKELYEKEVLGQ